MAAIVTAPPAGSAQANASAYSDRRRKAALLVVALACCSWDTGSASSTPC